MTENRTMTVHLQFTTYFSTTLGLKDQSLEMAGGATLGDVIDKYLQENPEKNELLEKKNHFLKGKLRAIYMIGSKAVNLKEPIKDNDTVKVLKAFIGG